MTASDADITSCLRRSSLRCTRAGRAVLRRLMESTAPVTVKMLHRAAPRSDLATIHRLVERLERAGIVRAAHLDGKSRWFEYVDADRHYHHLVCRGAGCNRIERFNACAIAKLEKALFEQHGFEVQSHSVQLFGLCRHCRRRRIQARPNPDQQESSHAAF